MYNNYKRFVSEGGTIIFLDSNMFYAEVEFDKNNGTITLIKGHDWEYDGRSAKKSVGERWFYENREWVGSNFLVSDLREKIYFKNNPFNYTHFEENYVSNPNARILLDYEIETPKSRPHMENVTVATYDLKFGNGKVITIGLYGQNLINNTAFLDFFESLLFDSIDNTNATNFEGKVKNIFSDGYPMNLQNNITKDIDKFGITKIYPNKHGGREWYIDMNDPEADEIFSTKSNLSKQPDGSWQVNDESKGQVRLEIETPTNTDEWKNVEITGYARVIKTTGHEPYETSDLDNIFQWYARGDMHSSNFPCEGTSIKGRLYLNGDSSWIKEIWHAGGYTEEKGRAHVTSPLVWKNDSEGQYYDGKWFGFKVIIFNVNNDKAVKMDSYLDDDVNNTWRKINSLIDIGDWYSNDPEFYDVDCNRPKNYIVTNSGPIAGFRTDNIIWNLKYLSIREIFAG